jgi:hypothetical protein
MIVVGDRRQTIEVRSRGILVSKKRSADAISIRESGQD